MDTVYRIVIRRKGTDEPFYVQHNASYRPCVYTKLSTCKSALAYYERYGDFWDYRIEELKGEWGAVS